jgi:hypothetical protein
VWEITPALIKIAYTAARKAASVVDIAVATFAAALAIHALIFDGLKEEIVFEFNRQ